MKPLTALSAAFDLASKTESRDTRAMMHTSLDVKANPQTMVKSFHKIYGLPAPNKPVRLSVTDRYRRLHFIFSEFIETVQASGFELAIDVSEMPMGADTSLIPGGDAIKLVHVEGSQQDTIEMLDGLGDIVYVCFGMAIEMGYDLMPILREIHSSNLTKLDRDGQPIVNGQGIAALGQPMHNSSEPDGKILKGPDYMKPQLERVVQLPEKADG